MNMFSFLRIVIILKKVIRFWGVIIFKVFKMNSRLVEIEANFCTCLRVLIPGIPSFSLFFLSRCSFSLSAFSYGLLIVDILITLMYIRSLEYLDNSFKAKAF